MTNFERSASEQIYSRVNNMALTTQLWQPYTISQNSYITCKYDFH